MIKYRWQTYGSKPSITTVEVLRETEHFVYIKTAPGWSPRQERRERKDGSYFDTWEAAHAAMIAHLQRAIESETKRIDYAHGRIAETQRIIASARALQPADCPAHAAGTE